MELEGEEFRLEAENSDLRLLLAKAGIDAAEQEVALGSCSVSCWKNCTIG